MTRAARTLSCPATLEHLEKITRMVEELLRSNGVSGSDRFALGLAVDEACSNVIRYAYAPGTGTVRVECLVTPEEARVCIFDRGVPFNPLETAAPDTGAGLEDRPIGGLGIHLIRNLVDAASYERREGENVLCLTRRRSDRSCG